MVDVGGQLNAGIIRQQSQIVVSERKRRCIGFGVLVLSIICMPARGDLKVTDDTGRTISIPRPATRIVSLAPHITENVFAIGAGARLVGTADHSDYPPSAKQLPRVGSAHKLDLERIVALAPDLIIAWRSGNPAGEVNRLRGLGFPIFVTEPRSLADIATMLERLGVLMGVEPTAQPAAAAFREEAQRLIDDHSGRSPVRVFYQIWDSPLMTLSGAHIVSELLRHCGGLNVFADLRTLAPQVDIEAVLAADPDVILISGSARSGPNWVDHWRAWPRLKAVRTRHLYFISPDIIQRQTPRILLGMAQICKALENTRDTP